MRVMQVKTALKNTT